MSFFYTVTDRFDAMVLFLFITCGGTRAMVNRGRVCLAGTGPILRVLK